MTALASGAIAATAIGLGTPAYADPAPTPTPSNDPCTYGVVTGAIACVGYYGNNLLTGGVGSSTSSLTTYINQLLNGPATSPPPPYPAADGYNPPYTITSGTGTVLGSLSNLSGTDGVPFTYNFAPLQLSGYTVFAAHFGNFPDSNAPDVTAFWLLNLGAGTTSTVTINNGKGVSNAQILGTGTPTRSVPEPATWALMLLGFGGVGVAMRRSWKTKPALMQIA
jgi:hypothetical protein